MMLDVDQKTRARIAWLSSGQAIAAGGPNLALTDALKNAGFTIHKAAGWPAVSRPIPRSDIAVMDLRRSIALEEDAERLFQFVRRARAIAGAVVLAPLSTPASVRANLEHYGELCYLTDDAAAIVAVLRERLRTARIAEEAGERLKSLAAIAKESAPTGTRANTRPRALLLAGAPNHRALALVNALKPHETTSVLTASQVLRALEAKAFDGLIFLPTDKSDLLYALARALRRHRDLSRTPILAVAQDAETLSAFAALGCRTLDDDHLDEDAARRIADMVDRGRTSATLRRYLRATAKSLRADRNAQTAFFAHHVARLGARSVSGGGPLSLIGLNIDAEQKGAGGDPLSLAQRVVRAEDCALQLGADGLVVIAPNTPAADAEKMGARLAGVVAGRAPKRSKSSKRTGGGAPDDNRAAAVEWRPGETPDRFLVRLYAELNQQDQARALAP